MTHHRHDAAPPSPSSIPSAPLNPQPLQPSHRFEHFRYCKRRYRLLFAVFLGLAAIAVVVYMGLWVATPRYPIYADSDHYSSRTQQFFNTPAPMGLDSLATLQAMWAMTTHGKDFMPSEPLPIATPDWQVFLNDANHPHAKFVWLGHSTLLARVAGKTVLFDPVWADSVSPVPVFGNRFAPPPVPLSQLPTVDVIVISHSHYDHLDKATIRYFANKNLADKPVHFVVPLGMDVILMDWGVAAENITALDWWQSYSLDGTAEKTAGSKAASTLYAVPTRHDASRTGLDKNKSLWAAYVIKTPTEQFYFSGDSSYGKGDNFRQIHAKFGSFDLAFMENGQYNTAWQDNHMMPPQTVQAVQDIHAQRFMPIHWGAYALSIHGWHASVDESIPLAKAKGIMTLTPLMGQVFDKDTVTQSWWVGL